MTSCKFCHAFIEFKEILSTGRWTAVNLSGTVHRCKDKTEDKTHTVKYLPIGEDV